MSGVGLKALGGWGSPGRLGTPGLCPWCALQSEEGPPHPLLRLLRQSLCVLPQSLMRSPLSSPLVLPLPGRPAPAPSSFSILGTESQRVHMGRALWPAWTASGLELSSCSPGSRYNFSP